ncbi:glycosyltransferase family 4 protein [Desulfatitalea alkaliphila]|uniref:Glycosyltransferase family 4 protein n=1 Tax=Desulfatitalea alkaliphila TaxID=2929485 RepID=A0AA41ULC6_9BACT|nr:glycosyltransferase family 4 protein [Desulfatitalea alkaliphila]MCJ8502317.1 glycosyltransferase family 4 protein [Desulfatitalea alkaliphila]
MNARSHRLENGLDINGEPMAKNIGFISTRFAGTDGVSLEASKWAHVLTEAGHRCFWLAGELERDPEVSWLLPEAHFKHEKNQWINARVFGHKNRKAGVTDTIHAVKVLIKVAIEEFIEHFRIDMLIVENALTIPMHIPLGVALTEIIAERQIPTIAHHHDFHWERARFSVNAVDDYLRMAFPPKLNSLAHVVINSAGQEELALRTGASAIIIPNVLDFDHEVQSDPVQSALFRKTVGLKPEDKIILQPTRIVQRKGIEHAIELVKHLEDPAYKLVISHEAGDEGFEYAEWLKSHAREHGVDLRLFDMQVADPFNGGGRRNGPYTLWDIYPHADFITYPSLYEGFGNAFLEAIYFRKPLLVNRYAIFVRDIEPKGFDLVVMDGFLTEKNLQNVRQVLESTERRERMVTHNFNIARRYYSYSVLRHALNMLVFHFFGVEGGAHQC